MKTDLLREKDYITELGTAHMSILISGIILIYIHITFQSLGSVNIFLLFLFFLIPLFSICFKFNKMIKLTVKTFIILQKGLKKKKKNITLFLIK